MQFLWQFKDHKMLFKSEGSFTKEKRYRIFMYSEELMSYLYSYDMPKKDGKHNEKEHKPFNKNKAGGHKDFLCTLKKIYATVPVEFNHE